MEYGNLKGSVDNFVKNNLIEYNAYLDVIDKINKDEEIKKILNISETKPTNSSLIISVFGVTLIFEYKYIIDSSFCYMVTKVKNKNKEKEICTFRIFKLQDKTGISSFSCQEDDSKITVNYEDDCHIKILYISIYHLIKYIGQPMEDKI